MGLFDFINSLFAKSKSNTTIIDQQDDLSWMFKDFHKTEEYLLKKAHEDQSDIVSLHFDYNHFIKHYYKFRDIQPNALDKCIFYCKKDIEMFPEFKVAYIEQQIQLFGDKYNVETQFPRIPSFQQLAIIYEKQGEFEKAIEICQLAIKYNLHDNTKGGFEGRVTKLRKKLA